MIAAIKPYVVGGAIAACILVGAGTVWAVYAPQLEKAHAELITVKAELEAQRIMVAARDAADAEREKQLARVRREQKEAQDALKQALAAHSGWAGQPIPDDVARVLRDGPSDAHSAPKRGAVQK